MKYRAKISKCNDGDFCKKKKKEMFEESILGEIEIQFRVPRVYQYILKLLEKDVSDQAILYN